MNELIKLKSFPIETLKILLKDKTTQKNIIWATSSYEEYGADYFAEKQMTDISLIGLDSIVLQPRILKALEHQKERTRNHAEVFTPAWICDKMINYFDDEWNKTWQQYVDLKVLEITCGEAPYLVSRYDTSTGEIIDIQNRIGILDRKIRIVNENTDNEDDWFKWTIRAFQSVYGYEYQGDNLLIARINVLMTFIDYLAFKYNRQPTTPELNKIANIISWNIWQMDGLTGTVPLGEPEEEICQMSLFEDLQTEKTTPKSKIYNWRSSKSVTFKGENCMKFDFVIGNPPYQQETSNEITTNGQKSRKNIFHYFQLQADEIANENTIMIYPAGRWIHQSGKGLKQFGYNQINDYKLSKLYFYPDSKEIFGNSADLSDGISIVIKSMNKKTNGFDYIYCKNGEEKSVFVDNPKDDLIPLNPENIIINNKINQFIKNYNLKSLHDSILSRSLFGIESDFVYKNQEKVRPYNDGDTFDVNTEIKLFTNDKAGKAGRGRWYIAKRDIIENNQEYINQWQVVVSSANAGGQKRDNQIEIIDNYSAFGRSRVALGSFKTYNEALNFYNYANTYFVKYAFLMTDEALTSLGKSVPDLKDYTNNNKIVDFSKDLDSQLFKLSNLSSYEIDYIKTVIDNIR